MELELQLRLKDKMIIDLQREMEQMRVIMRRHGIATDDSSEFGTGDGETLLTSRSSTIDGSAVDMGEVQEELPMEPLETVVEHDNEGVPEGLMRLGTS